MAIGGLAYILGHATEQLGAAAGPRVGGILNATVGNVGEIIIAGFLIANNELDVVKASITGSIVGNLLLVLRRLAVRGRAEERDPALRRPGHRHERRQPDPGHHRPHRPGHLRRHPQCGGRDWRGSPVFFNLEVLSVGVAVVLLLTYAAQTYLLLLRPPEATGSRTSATTRRSRPPGACGAR